ncbi:MarR family transcriptional regulator [Nocardia sp. BMG51109]|uniref:MarR family transcriptional regulator n=1 Tax=Nocardia sp. BMG51109 TaxID=1056816 RepID=UPI000560A3A4|nr:MarR family transcriptional regulator [Nocardia sp. BMG51109]
MFRMSCRTGLATILGGYRHPPTDIYPIDWKVFFRTMFGHSLPRRVCGFTYPQIRVLRELHRASKPLTVDALASALSRRPAAVQWSLDVLGQKALIQQRKLPGSPRPPRPPVAAWELTTAGRTQLRRIEDSLRARKARTATPGTDGP